MRLRTCARRLLRGRFTSSTTALTQQAYCRPLHRHASSLAASPWAHVAPEPADPILGLVAAFHLDDAPRKVGRHSKSRKSPSLAAAHNGAC